MFKKIQWSYKLYGSLTTDKELDYDGYKKEIAESFNLPENMGDLTIINIKSFSLQEFVDYSVELINDSADQHTDVDQAVREEIYKNLSQEKADLCYQYYLAKRAITNL